MTSVTNQGKMSSVTCNWVNLRSQFTRLDVRFGYNLLVRRSMHPGDGEGQGALDWQILIMLLLSVCKWKKFHIFIHCSDYDSGI